MLLGMRGPYEGSTNPGSPMTAASTRMAAALLFLACLGHGQMSGGAYRLDYSAMPAQSGMTQGGLYSARTSAETWGTDASGGAYAETSSIWFLALASPVPLIISPGIGSVVQGAVTITVQGTSASIQTAASPAAKLELFIDGALRGVGTALPYTYVWNTTSVDDGPHTITAIIYDGEGQTVHSAPTTLTVSNAAASLPFGQVFAYPNPATNGRATVHVESTGLDSLRVRFYDLTGRLVHQAELGGAPQVGVNGKRAYEYAWSLGGIAAGGYIYVVEGKLGGQTNRAMGKIAVLR